MSRTPKKPERPEGSGRLSAEQAAGLQDRLLDAALELFSADGFAGTSMERIAKKAGASTKTVYSRFSDKAEILQAVVWRIVNRLVATHQQQNAFQVRDAEPRKFLVTLGMEITRNLLHDAAGLNRLALGEAWRFNDVVKFYCGAYAQGTALVSGVLGQWKEAGVLPDLDDVEAAADMCLGMISDRFRILSALNVPVSDREREAHITVAVDIFLRSCGYDPKPKRS